jgi:hypothetical protein
MVHIGKMQSFTDDKKGRNCILADCQKQRGHFKKAGRNAGELRLIWLDTPLKPRSYEYQHATQNNRD